MEKVAYRLTDLIGFRSEVSAYIGNEEFYKGFGGLISEEVIVGSLDKVNGSLLTEKYGSITKTELDRYFERVELFEVEVDVMCEVFVGQEWSRFIPRVKYKPHYLNECVWAGDLEVGVSTWKYQQLKVDAYRFRNLPKPSWQEQVSEEFEMAYVKKDDTFVQMGEGWNSEGMLKLAKRVIELSRGEK